MNEGALSSRLGLAGWPAVAEEAIIARDVLLAEHVGSRLHVCHVSTAGSVEVLRWARRRGVAVTAEVTPHHLLLTEELVAGYDPVYKVNPPLRAREDVEALRAAVADGTIDVIATDHAPHPREDKDCEWAAAAMGMLGLQTAFGVVVETLVAPGALTLREVAERMSMAPARIGRVVGQGEDLVVGAAGNVAVVDTTSRTEVRTSALASKSSNSPYVGMTLPGRVWHVAHAGRLTVRAGELT